MDMRPDGNAVASPFTQERLQSSVVRNLMRGSETGTCLNLDAEPDEQLSTMPYCFIADTDSITVALDTGANHIIVNEKCLLTNFRVSKERVKGLQGKPITAGGQGRICLNLESVDGHVEAINHLAIYCPTSPYNLAPPQLLVWALKKRGYHARAYHDNEEYVLQYSHPNSGVHKMKTPISPNDLFLAQMNHGYKSFFREASKCGPTWSCFAGVAYANTSAIIEDDTMQTPTLTDAPVHDNRPENAVTIEYDERVDFAPLPNVPNRFEVSEGAHSQIPEGDPQLFRIRQKQLRLATFHEKRGHVSFNVLNRLAQAGLIPKDLANVPPPKCPGCQYGKAHRKPW